MCKDFRELIGMMTLEEKASLCSGLDYWHTKPIERLDIPSILVSDGPHGIRRQLGKSSGAGMGQSGEATCFPTACTSACSFDRDLLFEMGVALALECIDQEVSVLLGPGANIKRSPLCGRNFEYISEDPFVTGELASAIISGIQSKNIGTSLKHFAANSQEKARMVSNSIVDERALREIYLAGFEKAVKKAAPWTMMSSYNLVNGTYAGENRRLLTDILRNEWGFDGVVMSDWGAVNERSAALSAGLELEMPPSGGINDRRIADAVKSGSLSEDILDSAVMRMLDLVFKTKNDQSSSEQLYEKHNELARRIAVESAVLLKNDGILPASRKQNIAVIGAFARHTRYQGSGSSKINPTQVSSVYDAFAAEGIPFEYAEGYPLSEDDADIEMINHAVSVSQGKDIVFIFAGLPEEFESEGFDRTHINLPASQNKLISEVAGVNSNVAVILFGGSPCAMPWISAVKSVLLCYLPGQAAGQAAYDLLFGKAVPCGKLAETFPVFLSDNPSYPYFGGSKNIEYRESIFVGYRYYDASNKAVLFPFGFGLSYSSFAYRNLTLSSKEIFDSDTLYVTLDVENTGDYDAREIVQLYVEPPVSRIYKAKKELRGFAKINLAKGETSKVSFTLDNRSFAYFNINIMDWHVESGTYKIHVAASSRDTRLTAEVDVTSTAGDVSVPDYRRTAPSYYSLESNSLVIPQQQFEAVYGTMMPTPLPVGKGYYHANSTLSEIRKSFIGRYFANTIHRRFTAQYSSDSSPDEMRMMEAMFEDMPLRGIVNFSGGEIGFALLNALIKMMNGHLIRGILAFLNGIK